MEKQMSLNDIHVKHRHQIICDTWKKLIDVGTKSSVAIKYISDNSKELFGDECYSTKAVWGRLQIEGLTGPNGYVKQKSLQDHQPA